MTRGTLRLPREEELLADGRYALYDPVRRQLALVAETVQTLLRERKRGGEERRQRKRKRGGEERRRREA